jgi:hypothetical protein
MNLAQQVVPLALGALYAAVAGVWHVVGDYRDARREAERGQR